MLSLNQYDLWDSPDLAVQTFKTLLKQYVETGEEAHGEIPTIAKIKL